MLVVAAFLGVAAVFTAPLTGVSAQTSTVISGIVVGVDPDPDGGLARFAISDSSGQITTFEVSGATEFGLENQAGDRWVSTVSAEPLEAVRRLQDHRERFAPITVSFENGVAISVVEREEGKLETSLGYLFAVFVVTWALFFAYVLYMGRKQRVLQHEIAQLKGAAVPNGLPPDQK